MPCYDSRDDDDRKRNAQLVDEYAKKIDNLTEMLCLMCSKEKFEDLDPKVRGWYSRHLDNDRKRVLESFKSKLQLFSEKVDDMEGFQLRQIEQAIDSILI